MKLTDEMRHFLNEVAEQLRMDGVAIKVAAKIVKKHEPDLAEMIEHIREKSEQKWEQVLELLD